MNLLTLSRKFTVVIALMSMPLIALATPEGGGRPPAPDMSGMSKELGVSEGALKTCMPKPERGQRPERPNPDTITACLVEGGASVTTDKVGDALKEFGPKRG